MIIRVSLLLLLVFLNSAKLYQVVSLFRHGARTHVNSIYDGNSTFDIWGELTAVGMRQHQNLGKILNIQYIQHLSFLSPKYNQNQIEVYSTDYNRTISSAISQLYGLYPPGNGPRLQYVQRNYHLPPFTNQTDIEQQNFALPQGHQHILIKFDPHMLLENCPKLQDLIQKNINYHQHEYEEMNITYSPFIKKTIQVFNLSSNSTFQTLSSLCSTLIVDKYMSKPLPIDYSEEDMNNLQHIYNWLSNVKYSGNVSKVVNSKKYEKIISQFDKRINNLQGYPLKWSFLSGHDTDIVPIKTDLNFSSFQCIQDLYRKGKTQALNCQPDVGYASSLIFQLHSDNDKDFYVMIRSQGKYMNLCEKESIKCNYTEWKNRVKKNMISNVDQICGLKRQSKKGE